MNTVDLLEMLKRKADTMRLLIIGTPDYANLIEEQHHLVSALKVLDSAVEKVVEANNE